MEDADSGVRARVVRPEQFPEVLAKHKGKVVLVDFWATWCAPCRKSFPHTVAMAEKYADRGLAVITVAFDEPDAYDDVLKFLVEQHATRTENLICAHGGSEESFAGYSIRSGALPHFKVYDRNGKLFASFEIDPLAEKQFTLEDVEKAVLDALGAN
ncbi:MAG: TlpA family protein disulfide reductase [Planctomycetota bacterium]|nr:MAG: TlpA family protein disulfide reductase [Planctomycetota bacterium]